MSRIKKVANIEPTTQKHRQRERARERERERERGEKRMLAL